MHLILISNINLIPINLLVMKKISTKLAHREINYLSMQIFGASYIYLIYQNPCAKTRAVASQGIVNKQAKIANTTMRVVFTCTCPP